MNAHNNADTDEAQTTFQVEVYQPRSLSQYLGEDNREPKDGFEDIYHDLRDLRGGFMDADDITHDQFTRLWTLAGGDEVEAEDEDAALHATFEQWNNGSGRESEAFRQANEEHRAVSLSAGDIIRVDGTTYYCAPVGWEQVDL